MSKNVNYAKGISMGAAQYRGGDSESIDYTVRAFELMEMLSEATALTTGAAATALGCSRQTAGTAFNSLWWAGMARWVNVFAEIGQFKGQFRLWYPADVRPPKDAQEACRLAALGLFYALAKNEVPGFKWRVIRNGKHGVTAEMQFIVSDNITQWVIDAPRREENPITDADVYIFPTTHEGKTLTPVGKMYTADELLFTPGELRRKIFQRTS
ncbi:MAG TPA: hypothetical protein GXX25_02160 [Desulfotomaculum sp.]|nr:hypothetical protein [Desulfotomaculum sp.]